MVPFPVLHIVEDMKIGGLEKVLASIVLGLDRKKYRPEVWCLSRGGEMADELMRQDVKVRILNLETYHNPLNIVHLTGLMRQARFSLLHTHGYFAGTFGRLSGWLAGVPVLVTHVHSTYFNYRKRNLWVERMLSHVTSKVICVSAAVQSFVTDLENIPKEKTCVIYNGVDVPSGNVPVEDMLQTRSSLGIGDNEILLIVVASLKPLKGHAFLFHALSDIFQRVPNFRLLVVGDGPQRKDLEAQAEHLGIASRILFTGTRDDVQALLRISDIFILPSVEREGVSMAIIEAMASGLPVVSTLLGGIPEVVENGSSGYLVPPGDRHALSEVLTALMENSDLRNKMGEKGKEIHRRAFTRSRMVQNIEDLYDHLLNRKGR